MWALSPILSILQQVIQVACNREFCSKFPPSLLFSIFHFLLARSSLFTVLLTKKCQSVLDVSKPLLFT